MSDSVEIGQTESLYKPSIQNQDLPASIHKEINNSNSVQKQLEEYLDPTVFNDEDFRCNDI